MSTVREAGDGKRAGKTALPARLAATALVWCVCCAAPAQAQFGPPGAGEGPPARPADPDGLAGKTAKAAKALDAEHQKKYGDNGDYLVRPGLLADRKARTVRLSARATGLSQHDPVEFFLIPTDSGKDYEAMAVTFAKPSDVHAALEFIGLKPGRPVQYQRHHLWPRGERVALTYEWQEPPAKEGEARRAKRVRAEELILDHRSNKVVEPAGLIFTGSYVIKPDLADPDVPRDARPMYAADVSDSRSIASVYNEPSTVLDVPFQWYKSDVYGFLKPNPAHRFTPGQAVTVVIEPLPAKDGGPRVIDLTLRVSMPEGKTKLQDARYELLDAAGKPAAEGTMLHQLLAAFKALGDAGKDPFVTIDVDGGMSLSSVAALFKVVREIDNVHGIRVEAPPPGQLFYRAFFPRAEWRDRSKRLGRPWELQVSAGPDGKAVGELCLPADDIDDNGGRGDLKFPVRSPQEVAETLAKNSDRWSQTVYVFPQGEIRYGALLEFIRPAMKTHETMWVFPAKAP